MSDETLLTQQAANDLLRAYGAAPKHWPEAHREALRRAIECYPDLKTVVEEEVHLDRRLDVFEPTPTMTVEGVMASVGAAGGRIESSSRGWLERFIDWLVPPGDVIWWRGAVTAAVPLFVGVWLGSAVPADREQWSETEQGFFSSYHVLDIGEIDND